MTTRPVHGYLTSLQVFYDLVYAGIFLFGMPVVLLMLLVNRRWRAGLRQRLGFCPRREGDRPAVWIHGVSVGEVLAAKELVHLIDEEMPWLEVVLSTTTLTGQRAAQRTYPGKMVVYFPLDFSFATRRLVRRIRPSLVMLMELELWPNFLLTTSQFGVPVLLANGRMSPRSERRYKLLQTVIPEPMDRVRHYCVQSEEYAQRFRALGVPDDRISITGSMKFDTVADNMPAEILASYRERLAVSPGAFVIVAGSTHGDEEEVVLDAFLEIRSANPEARLVLCPRHPERLDEVQAAVESRELEVVRLSTLAPGGPPPDRVTSAVVLVDTFGELARLYALADLVFVGGSLTGRGGQNMMEPAGLGKAVVVGPNTWNFRDPVELLLSQGGLSQVSDADQVRRELLSLHRDPERRRSIGERARRVCLKSKGATRRILEILQKHIPSSAGPGSANSANAKD